MNKKYIYKFLLTIILAIPFCLVAQIQNQLIVKSKLSTSDLREILSVHITPAKILNTKTISRHLSLTSIQLSAEISEFQLNKIKLETPIDDIYFDEKIDLRKSPNDPNFADQWGIALTKIDEVWDYTTGGQLADGQEIVIAVLDDGMQIDHPDLADNIWVNQDEIPNNNKDDDNNGYVDDYYGLNIDTGNDKHKSLAHGTSVAGILGAIGDNELGIAGVNWDIKILPITGVDQATDVIEALNYIADTRAAYNQSNGQKGALILVSSYSGGRERVFGNSGIFKDWCESYEVAGRHGVLNFGASANLYINVDEEGDMPSTCPSDFFVAVTSLKRGGKVDKESAFGPKNVDIAAPGDGLYTLENRSGYDLDFTGTSAATPMAAGVAALLYASPCQNLAKLVNADPSAAALYIKQILLDGVTYSDAMKSLYSSKGYLNALRSLSQMVAECDNLMVPAQIGALRFLNIKRDGNQVKVFFVSPNNEEHFIRWSDPLGRIIGYQTFTPSPYGEKMTSIQVPTSFIGPLYLSIGTDKFTVSEGFVLLN